jgi:hypothetical protein
MLSHSQPLSDDQLCASLLGMFPADSKPSERLLPPSQAALCDGAGLADRRDYDRAVSVARQRGYVEETDPRVGDVSSLILTAAGKNAWCA